MFLEGAVLVERAPFTVVRVRDDYSLPWHLRRTDMGPYKGLLSRHRSEDLAEKAKMKMIRAWIKEKDLHGRPTGGVTTSQASMGAMAPPVY